MPGEPHGHLHQAAVHRSDDEFLSTVLPFVQQGIEAGQPLLACLPPRKAALLRDASPDAGGITFLDQADVYANPATAVKQCREQLGHLRAQGAAQVHFVGELVDPGRTTPWGPWARYEAAVNHLYEGLPLWSLCTYDARTTPRPVLDDVVRTHPWLALPGGRHAPSAAFAEPLTFLETHAFDPAEGDLPSHTPTLALQGPYPEQARAAANRVSELAGLDRMRTGEFVLAVSESVTNALHHGKAPMWLHLWSEPGRAVATVTDAGGGPTDPFAGLTPAPRHPADGGMGLWIVHQVCDYVAMHRHDDGYSIVLVCGDRTT
ncbi:sensor histidine kinase [Saccharomonospora azurea]|uniref:sensor histidine kinase n=1 Tax=Saccharomonospora azurea TaxID=40988 RepID=UPI00331EBA0A